MAIFSFQARPSKAIGKTILFPLISASHHLMSHKWRMWHQTFHYVFSKYKLHFREIPGFDCIESEKFKEATYVQAFRHAKDSPSRKRIMSKKFLMGGGETQQLDNWIHTSGHVKPLLVGKEKKKEGFLIKGMGARAHVITPHDNCWVFIAKWYVKSREIHRNKRKLKPFPPSFNDHWYLSRLFGYV